MIIGGLPGKHNGARMPLLFLIVAAKIAALGV